MQTTTQIINSTQQGLWIDIEILKDTNLSLQEKFVLAIIKALDKNNGCFASNKYFADILQVTSKRASDIIQSLLAKNYITSVVEDNYKRTIRMVVKEVESVENKEEEVAEPQEQKPQTLSSTPTPNKPIIWRGMDLSTFKTDAIERIKRRFPEIEAFLKGERIDETQPPTFRTNEDLYTTYCETPSEWQGISQLQFA